MGVRPLPSWARGVDPKLAMLGLGLGLAAFFVPPLFRTATLATAMAMLVLAPLPRGTRRLTFAVMIGLATGTTAISSFAISIFQAPVTREFGWTQSEYSLVLTPMSFILVVIAPVVGRLFDRQGVRRFALGSTAFLGFALASLHGFTGSRWYFYLLFALMQLLGAGTSSVAYSRVVARWFRARRGQAFGAALAGIGIGGAVLSALSEVLISRLGWRDAYVGLGLLLLCVTLPVLYFWLHDQPDAVGLAEDGEPLAPQTVTSSSKPTGYSAQESRRQPRFWAMLLSFFILASGIGGVMLQLFPILRSRGIAPEAAAAIQGALGLALILGRSFAGFLMDRLFAPYVAAFILLFPIAGSAMLASGAVGWQATLAALCMGLAAGAEIDVIAYLVTRYFGTRSYAENYGWQYAAWCLGAGTAPVLTALSMDRLGTYTPVLWLYVGAFALAALMILRLGPYPAMASALREGPG